MRRQAVNTESTERDWTPTVPAPSLEQLMEWEAQGYCEATDGCGPIEPDGYCEHGYPSWLIELGYM